MPSLTHAWQIPASAFSLAFLWSNLGMIAGALISGPIGDRIGCRPLLHLIGLTPAQAVFATSLQTLGGFLAVLYLGVAIDRFGNRSLALHYALGIVFIGLIALSMFPYLALLAIVVLSGLTVIGSQTGLNAAVENSIRRECARPATVLRNGVG